MLVCIEQLMTELNRWTSGSEYSSCAQSLTQCNTLDALCDLHYDSDQLLYLSHLQHTTLLALPPPLRCFIFVCVRSLRLSIQRKTSTRSTLTAVTILPTAIALNMLPC
jgi:hypothetical protein